MLHGFEPRLYQETILSAAALKNTLVVLPTGMGKTGVALLLAAQRLQNFPKSKVLVLAPTRPLVEQHIKTFREFLDVPEQQFVVFTGNVLPERRGALWDSARVVFSTPQVIENDVITGRISLKDVSLVVFDEAHRAAGDYSYVFVAKQYFRLAEWPRILALTASPGSEIEKIEEVCRNLFIEGVEVRTDKDADVQPYLHQVDVERLHVVLPDDFLRIKACLERCKRSRISELRKFGVRADGFFSKKEVLRLQRLLQAKLASGERDFEVLKGVSILAEIVKVDHALELLETQSVGALSKYLCGLFNNAASSKVKAVKNLVADADVKGAFALVNRLVGAGVEHPKIAKVKEIVKEVIEKDRSAKVILFTQFRDTAVVLKEALSGADNVVAEVFVGQAKKNGTGLSQKEQAEMLDLFRDGAVNVLIATSVGEEGLDIPSVDVVMFYEPIPSAIRAIQRRGRTGRHGKGRIVLFVTKGTRDEGYLWSSRAKERQMGSVLDKLRNDLRVKFVPAQSSLAQFSKVKIFADYREKSSGVVRSLVDHDVELKLEMLASADYILSSRVGVELKTVPDFVNSIVDGRLLDQLKSLRKNFERPIIILQGLEDVYSVRNVHPNAIRGMFATISVSYGIPIIRTKDDVDSAAFLVSVAKREQDSHSRDFSPHADRKPVSLKEQQEYIVSALPCVGPVLARTLLKAFGSVEAVFAAGVDDLKNVPGVGDKIAASVRELVSSKY